MSRKNNLGDTNIKGTRRMPRSPRPKCVTGHNLDRTEQLIVYLLLKNPHRPSFKM